MFDYILFAIIILISSILQTSTGFGFSIMATPFLLLLFSPADAVQINLILSLFISTALIAKIKKDVDREILKRFITGSFLGVLIGVWILLTINLSLLKIGVSLLILLLTVLLILNFRIRQTYKRDLVVGGFSGALTASIGMPGPPLLLYFSGTEAKKEKLRATTLAFYLYIYSVSLFLQVIFVGTTTKAWIASGIGLPLVVIGLFIGQILFRYINQRIFRIFTYIILIFTGVYLLFGK
ncbi:sulfite exporter TauE/SafE family protein [Lederbergia lenta]|uniref:Probable membrane transporter protein n=1 Tax=Lederbergia lenta TaxID=1467 RepID=A0A2X4WJS1_LEDLE|nr:sulfite exporter TauE/SafE family protein [Lederbergia lenta]MEC2323388.1 sulfite exporter TauE/SafE family protein [Lederbergia lenta]SQI63341.1 membrane protein [Lederbergia lenta]